MATTYQIDAAHSAVQFSVRHMMVSNVRGAFSGVKGSVVYDPAKPEATQVEATIDVASINTNDAQRDTHLKSPEFLDAEKYPTMTFRSKLAAKKGDGLNIVGDLTLHGVTREVALDVEEISGEAKDPWGHTKLGATATGKLKRSEFGLTWNAAIETGGVLVGDDVKLSFDLQFAKA